MLSWLIEKAKQKYFLWAKISYTNKIYIGLQVVTLIGW